MNFRRFLTRSAILPAFAVCIAVLSAQPPAEDAALPMTVCGEYQGAPNSIAVAAASDSRSIYIAGDTGKLTSIDASSAKAEWSADIAGSLISNILPLENSVVFVSAAGTAASGTASLVTSISKQTGITQWTASLPGASRFYVLDVDGAIIAADNLGAVAGLSRDGGKILWQSKLPGAAASDPAATDSLAAFAGSGNEITVIAANDGRPISKFTISSVPTAIAFGEDNTIITGDDRGNLVLRKLEKGERIWKFKNGARIGSVTDTERGILVGSFDNFLYLISHRNGNVIWKHRFSGRILGAPLIIGDRALVTTGADGNFHLIDMENGKLLQRLSISDAEYAGLAPVKIGEAAAFPFQERVRFIGLPGCP